MPIGGQEPENLRQQIVAVIAGASAPEQAADAVLALPFFKEMERALREVLMCARMTNFVRQDLEYDLDVVRAAREAAGLKLFPPPYQNE